MVEIDGDRPHVMEGGDNRTDQEQLAELTVEKASAKSWSW
jgi:hypothetical protein